MFQTRKVIAALFAKRGAERNNSKFHRRVSVRYSSVLHLSEFLAELVDSLTESHNTFNPSSLQVYIRAEYIKSLGDEGNRNSTSVLKI